MITLCTLNRSLAKLVISDYLVDLESNFDDILAFLFDRFNEDDLNDASWMSFDILLCGLLIDGMALFNLLDHTQANRIFKYISVEKFVILEDEQQIEYSIKRISEYKNIWDNAMKKSELPFDYIFSKLLNGFLGENIDKYNISPMDMMQIMSKIMPIFSGKWKNALERYKPIQ